MCGIAGCYGANDTLTIKKMISSLPHRGPDDCGIFSKDNFILGHTRLSIVDVAMGHQPIITDDQSSGIICNGEIYNFLELKKPLEKKFTFSTNSDTEVILHLYRDMGLDFLNSLDGMFAFALFDNDVFVLARDHIGIKPLYYGYKDDNFYFSSELGAMTNAGIEDVHEFPAGYYYTPEKGFVRYYEIPIKKNWGIKEEDEAISIIRDKVKKAIKKRLLSDNEIHVGAFCSGGLDSSLISAIAKEDIPNLHTFAVGMKDRHGDDSDDLKAARVAAEYIGSNHHELIFTEDDYYDALPTVIRSLESYDPSLVRCAVPCYFTCRLAAQFVTVVLTGEGADELFAGYHYMKNFPLDKINNESHRCISTLHNINLQRADRMGMLFSLELRVPFLDLDLIETASKISPELKIKYDEEKKDKIEKWILRKAFSGTGYLPEEILWRYKVQYTQGAGCESLGAKLAERELSDSEFVKIRDENPNAIINSKEAAYYFKIFKEYHTQDSILNSIGIWNGFDFEEERIAVKGSF